MKYSRDKYLLDIKEIEKFNEIYIYGTGVSSQKLKDLVQKSSFELNILGFIDTYKKTSKENGINIININDFKDINKTVIICTYYEEWIDEIVEILEKKEIYNYFINMIILDPMYSLDDEKDKLFKNKTSYIASNFKKDLDLGIWNSVINALKDNTQNKELFENYYNFGHQQYLDCITIKPNDIVIEGGVFDGITTLKIAKKLENGRVYAFDPLLDNEKSELYTNDKITIIKKALWHKNQNLYFVNKGAGSYVSDKKDESIPLDKQIKIEALSVDEFINKEKVVKYDLLKLDVEGAEQYVLNGALTSIKKYRPKLAISIYHSLEDFFEIPELLMKELEDYDFFIRLYSGALMDTVLYALPKEQK